MTVIRGARRLVADGGGGGASKCSANDAGRPIRVATYHVAITTTYNIVIMFVTCVAVFRRPCDGRDRLFVIATLSRRISDENTPIVLTPHFLCRYVYAILRIMTASRLRVTSLNRVMANRLDKKYEKNYRTRYYIILLLCSRRSCARGKTNYFSSFSPVFKMRPLVTVD